MSNLHNWHFLVMLVSYWCTEDLASSAKSIISLTSSPEWSLVDCTTL